MFQILSSSIQIQEFSQLLINSQCGAYVSFEGWVRNFNDGKPVLGLDYQVYAELAIKEGEKIIHEAYEKFQIQTAYAVHREGPLELGECAVWIGVTSVHRKAAFEACQYIIDQIKARLPIWKQEHYEDGTREWVLCTHNHSAH